VPARRGGASRGARGAAGTRTRRIAAKCETKKRRAAARRTRPQRAPTSAGAPGATPSRPMRRALAACPVRARHRDADNCVAV